MVVCVAGLEEHLKKNMFLSYHSPREGTYKEFLKGDCDF